MDHGFLLLTIFLFLLPPFLHFCGASPNHNELRFRPAYYPQLSALEFLLAGVFGLRNIIPYS
ncbi:hypothetical protein C7212DRAFT_325399 [Tuber magnatum]|uniref:Uncharacterized protein n=1 Tax=Tuber magnatum TaxID=42249 RepID=A0A317SPA7_9PEZI|nr:hypothetical protein C7212DRAFT_325399 [Tuber magnatum]